MWVNGPGLGLGLDNITPERASLRGAFKCNGDAVEFPQKLINFSNL
jgi:hypothetical protein